MRLPGGTGWGQAGNSRGPPDHNTAQHNHQAAINTSYPRSKPEPGRVVCFCFFLLMQFDLPSSSQEPANRTLPESADLVPAVSAATVIFNKS